jgi:hypothetical protein
MTPSIDQLITMPLHAIYVQRIIIASKGGMKHALKTPHHPQKLITSMDVRVIWDIRKLLSMLIYSNVRRDNPLFII